MILAVDKIVGIFIIVAGMLLIAVGAKFMIQTSRSMPRRRAVKLAFGSAFLITNGIGVGMLGLCVVGAAWRLERLQFFLWIVPLGILFGVASAIREYLSSMFIHTAVQRGMISDADAYPYDKSIQK